MIQLHLVVIVNVMQSGHKNSTPGVGCTSYLRVHSDSMYWKRVNRLTSVPCSAPAVTPFDRNKSQILANTAEIPRRLLLRICSPMRHNYVSVLGVGR